MLKFGVYNMYNYGKEDVEKEAGCRASLLKTLFHQKAVGEFPFKSYFVSSVSIKKFDQR